MKETLLAHWPDFSLFVTPHAQPPAAPDKQQMQFLLLSAWLPLEAETINHNGLTESCDTRETDAVKAEVSATGCLITINVTESSLHFLE